MKERLHLLRLAVTQRCQYEANWSLTRWQRYGYTLKIIICIIFNRAHGEIKGSWHDGVEVATYNFGRWQSFEFGEAADWDVLVVAYGWRDWKYTTDTVGYP